MIRELFEQAPYLLAIGGFFLACDVALRFLDSHGYDTRTLTGD